MTRYGDVLEISNSEVRSYMDCKRRWWLTYIRSLRLRSVAPIGPLSIGGRVHKALEQGYSSPGREAELMRVLAESIEEDYPKAQAAGVLDQFESECELALIMLEGFVEWASEEGLDADWEVVRSEGVVRSPVLKMGPQEVLLKGKLDQVVRRMRDGSLWMRDWKTTPTMKPVMMAFGPQLKMYILLLSLTEPDAAVTGGQFVFLKKVKRTARANPPFYSVEPLTVSPKQMDAYWRQLTATINEMVETQLRLEAGGDHHALAPPRPTRDCSWMCPFYNICDMFDDGSRVEQLLEDAYEVYDPYAYYDEDPDDKAQETT